MSVIPLTEVELILCLPARVTFQTLSHENLSSVLSLIVPEIIIKRTLPFFRCKASKSLFCFYMITL